MKKRLLETGRSIVDELKLKRHTITREFVFLYILINILCGCSVITGTKENTVYPSWEERKKQILEWANSEKIKVDKGALKNSEYWKQYYRKTIELRPDLDDFLCYANEMVKVSRIFEEGKISKEQFEDKHRQLTALLEQEEDRRAKMLAGTTINGENEATLFFFYSKSLFFSYVEDLRRQLSASGSQLSVRHCSFFNENIQCTTQSPFF